MRNQISIIDDDAHMLRYLGKVLSTSGADVLLYNSPQRFLASFEVSGPDVIVLDLLMPEMSGIDVLQFVRKRRQHIPVIMLTTEAKIETAVRAMKAGVDDYITKPIDKDEFVLRVRRALEVGALRSSAKSELLAKRDRFSVTSIVGESKHARKLREEAVKAISAPARPIWILGEYGAGKRHLARVIHYGSAAIGGLLATYRANQIEPDEQRAFFLGQMNRPSDGGTPVRQRGVLEQADGGTVIIEHPEKLEPSVLRAFYDAGSGHGIRPVGSNEDIPVNVRVIFVSDVADIEALTEKHNIDPDLLRDIGDSVIQVPSLAKRPEDIPDLTHFYLEENSMRRMRNFSVDEEAMARLVSYAWPHNISELHNALDRAMLDAVKDVITLRNLTLGTAGWSSGQTGTVFSIPQGLSIKDLQGEYVRQTLEFFQSNLEKTAASLSISRKTLWEIRKKFDLP